MTDLAPHGLFSPEGVPLREPEEVERALTALWRPAAREATGDETATATRVSIANLLVVTSADQWNDVLAALGELSPLYPTRTIALLIEAAAGDAAPEPIRVSVSAICHVPQPGEAQVCCEQIVLRAGQSQVEFLDKTVLPLLEADLPVMCWWRASPLAWPQLSAAIRSIAARWIVDHLGFEHLESSATCAVRELAWYRTAGLRELVAQMFDGCTPEAIEAITQVEIKTGPHAEDQAQGIWLAAFLAGQLGWTPSAAESMPPHEVGAGRLSGRVRFLARGREIEIQITPPDAVMKSSPVPGQSPLRYMKITSESNTFELDCCAHRRSEYRLTICSGSVCQAPRTVQVQSAGTSQSLAAALVGRRADPVFERARPIAAWLAGVSSRP